VADRRGLSDRLVLGGLALAVVVLLATIAVAVVAYVNPTVSALRLPAAGGRGE
jgi:hypothetical protein